MQLLTGLKLTLSSACSSPTSTVQAPQSPSLQPSLVPVQPACSRSQFSTEVVDSRPCTDKVSPR